MYKIQKNSLIHWYQNKKKSECFIYRSIKIILRVSKKAVLGDQIENSRIFHNENGLREVVLKRDIGFPIFNMHLNC